MGFVDVYIFEVIFIFLLLIQPFGRLFRGPTFIEKSYFVYALIALGAWFLGALVTNFIDFKALLLQVKYLSYVFLISFLRTNLKLVSEFNIRRALLFQYIFIFIAGGYVIYNMIFDPISLGSMIWEYSPKYRLIGLTGQSWSLSELKHIGNTSVQMGVHIAFLLLLSISLLIHTGERKYILIIIATFFSLLLTYSRSGLLVAFIGVGYIFLDKCSLKHLIVSLIPASIVFFSTSYYLDVWDFISSFGVFGKLVESSGVQDGSAGQRIIYMQTGINYLIDHPYFLLIGSGFGEAYTFSQIGTPHLESLILTTLFQAGLLGVSLLVLHFIAIWSFAAKNYVRTESCLIRSVLYSYKIYIPGFFLANVVGGNSLQTDFMAPFFYGILGYCMVLVSKFKSQRNLG